MNKINKVELYNTLTRKKEEFQTLEPGKVKMFVCGPTVYDYSHIGHAKTYIQMDVLKRALKAAGYDVFYLQNITDIDDKIIARAAENGEKLSELTARFEKLYLEDMESLGNYSVDQYARATDFIEQIIAQVQVLIDKGFGYVIDDGVYFEIAKFKEYGKLSGRREIKENDSQTRIDDSDKKKGWNDFCLWKFSKHGEPTWEAPFGAGRPGWHIEDTAITESIFGPQYDIHGGALDLIFPHHEAELTQMEAASGKIPFVRFWVHAGFLTVGDTKMSKSLSNFYTIREVLEKGYDPMAIRLFMLQSHYRAPINFSWENLDAAQNRLNNWRAIADLIYQSDGAPETISDGKASSMEDFILNAQDYLFDDLYTPKVLALIDSSLNDFVSVSPSLGFLYKQGLTTVLNYIDIYLGIRLDRGDISEEQKDLLRQRQEARDNKDFGESDKLRDELREQGIEVRDTDNGQIWSRV